MTTKMAEKKPAAAKRAASKGRKAAAASPKKRKGSVSNGAVSPKKKASANYTYTAPETSYLYKNLWSPICDKVREFISTFKIILTNQASNSMINTIFSKCVQLKIVGALFTKMDAPGSFVHPRLSLSYGRVVSHADV